MLLSHKTDYNETSRDAQDTRALRPQGDFIPRFVFGEESCCVTDAAQTQQEVGCLFEFLLIFAELREANSIVRATSHEVIESSRPRRPSRCVRTEGTLLVRVRDLI